MTASAPVVDFAAKTVSYEGRTFTIRPLTEESYTVLIAGVPLGRIVYSFGANAVVESPDVTEEALTAISEAWFAAVDAAAATE